MTDDACHSDRSQRTPVQEDSKVGSQSTIYGSSHVPHVRCKLGGLRPGRNCQCAYKHAYIHEHDMRGQLMNKFSLYIFIYTQSRRNSHLFSGSSWEPDGGWTVRWTPCIFDYILEWHIFPCFDQFVIVDACKFQPTQSSSIQSYHLSISLKTWKKDWGYPDSASHTVITY